MLLDMLCGFGSLIARRIINPHASKRLRRQGIEEVLHRRMPQSHTADIEEVERDERLGYAVVYRCLGPSSVFFLGLAFGLVLDIYLSSIM